MAATQDQTVWFPKDSILGIVLFIPLWGIAGLCWGSFMVLFMGGGLIMWLFAGVLWGASCWFFFAIYLLIAYREVSLNIPLQETATFPESLRKAVKPLWYMVEQQSSARFVCKPKFGLFRFLEFAKLQVRLLDGSVDLIGPAIAVKKARKGLLADSPAIASRADREK